MMKEVDTKNPTNDNPIGLKERLTAKISQISETSRYETTLEDIPTQQTYTSYERHVKASSEVLADRFAIGIERAKAKMRATLQRGVRSTILPLSRQYRADRQFGVKRLNGKFATGTLWSKIKSLRGSAAMQIYSNKCGFNKVYTLRKTDNESVGNSLKAFISDYGAPERLTYDGAAVQVGSKTLFQKILRRYEIISKVSAPRRPNEK